MKVNLSIVIPTLNNIKGLEYLLDFLKDKEIQVIVIDNKTCKEKKDFIASLLQYYKDRLTYLPQKRNLGFAESINLGAKFVKRKWMVILNDDIEFMTKNVFSDLVREAVEKKIDALSPILIKTNGKIENYGYKLLHIGKIELIKKFSFANNKIRPSNIDGLTAACLLMKTSTFNGLKGFDNNFFAYLEDVDYFLRFKKTGYKMSVSKNIKVVHHHMTTSKTMGNFKAKHDMINWWRLYFKHREIFKFDMNFAVERLRNFSGFIKATFSSFFFFQKHLHE